MGTEKYFEMASNKSRFKKWKIVIASCFFLRLVEQSADNLVQSSPLPGT